MPETNPAAFKLTRWSLVIQSQGEGEQSSRALEDLCRTYWFPLYSWSRRFGATPEDAEDYVQASFVHVLQKQLFAQADPHLGKLRTFMLTAFRRYVNHEQRKESRQKRGGGQVVSFDALEAEAWYEVEQVEGDGRGPHVRPPMGAHRVGQRSGKTGTASCRAGKSCGFRSHAPVF